MKNVEQGECVDCRLRCLFGMFPYDVVISGKEVR